MAIGENMIQEFKTKRIYERIVEFKIQGLNDSEIAEIINNEHNFKKQINAHIVKRIKKEVE